MIDLEICKQKNSLVLRTWWHSSCRFSAVMEASGVEGSASPVQDNHLAIFL